MSKVLFIGPVNRFSDPRGGSEYKNQMLVSLCEEECDVTVLDTKSWSTDLLFSFKLVLALVFHFYFDTILISASSRSTYRLLTLLTLNKQLGKKTVYFVIGGYLPTALEKGVYKVKPYLKLRTIVLETERMTDKMLMLGLNNVVCIPNFKKFPLNVTIKNRHSRKSIIRFVYLGRITKDKGINEIFSAVDFLNINTDLEFSVHFFGPVSDAYNYFFFNKIKTTPNTKYLGNLDLMKESERGYDILSGYDVMLFPTFWVGEGLAGVLIDAKAAGLPVIATDWNFNNELIAEGDNGLLIKPQNFRDLVLKMSLLIKNENLRLQLAKSSYDSRLKFHFSIQKKNVLNTLNTQC